MIKGISDFSKLGRREAYRRAKTIRLFGGRDGNDTDKLGWGKSLPDIGPGEVLDQLKGTRHSAIDIAHFHAKHTAPLRTKPDTHTGLTQNGTVFVLFFYVGNVAL